MNPAFPRSPPMSTCTYMHKTACDQSVRSLNAKRATYLVSVVLTVWLHRGVTRGVERAAPCRQTFPLPRPSDLAAVPAGRKEHTRGTSRSPDNRSVLRSDFFGRFDCGRHNQEPTDKSGSFPLY